MIVGDLDTTTSLGLHCWQVCPILADESPCSTMTCQELQELAAVGL